MSQKFDLIVIGSGFGGAVVACRAAQAGTRVLILERGRRWSPESYPRGIGDPWLFDHKNPHKKYGWIDLRYFKRMIVAQGAGVGGGSLCYSSVVLKASRDVFAEGWPADLSYDDLLPCYDEVARMLRLRTLPSGQLTQRTKLLREAAGKTGNEQRYFDAPLAVSFDDKLEFDQPSPLGKEHTRVFRNSHGRWQGTCVHLGNCDIGCDVQAKNTLDLNYLADAERCGAEICPLHVVRSLTREDHGYRVHFDRIRGGELVAGDVWAPRVVIAAGSLGSTELLLRCRDQYHTLPQLSRTLGTRWSPNGNVLTPAIYPDADSVRQSIGPTISSGLDFGTGSENGEKFVIEDDGFPNLLLNAARDAADGGWLSALGWSLRGYERRGRNEKNPLANVMVWLGAGVDAGDGQLRLRRPWYAPWKQSLSLDWNVKSAESVVTSILRVHEGLTNATGGKLKIPFLWRWLRTMITVHPLGGCGMGNTAETGVVNHAGEVFGYPGLFVCDGATIPRPIGRNPSMTIAALAERSAKLIFGDQVPGAHAVRGF